MHSSVILFPSLPQTTLLRPGSKYTKIALLKLHGNYIYAHKRPHMCVDSFLVRSMCRALGLCACTATLDTCSPFLSK